MCVQNIVEHLQSSVSQQVSLHLHMLLLPPPLPLPLLPQPAFTFPSQERDELERQVEELRSMCNVKVRAAEAKWEDAMATIERITQRDLSASHTSSSCQTHDATAPRVSSIASQTSSDSGGGRPLSQVWRVLKC